MSLFRSFKAAGRQSFDSRMPTESDNWTDMEQCVIERRQGMHETGMDGDVLALCVETGAVYGFEGPAAQAWLLLQEPLTFGVLNEALCDIYDVDQVTCADQMRRIIGQLDEWGLVTLRKTSTLS